MTTFVLHASFADSPDLFPRSQLHDMLDNWINIEDKQTVVTADDENINDIEKEMTKRWFWL